jgi:hypothetical protein
MDDITKAATAAAVYRYMVARARFRKGKLPEIVPGVPVTPASLEHELERGLRFIPASSSKGNLSTLSCTRSSSV